MKSELFDILVQLIVLILYEWIICTHFSYLGASGLRGNNSSLIAA
jgi:hypothetical protein